MNNEIILYAGQKVDFLIYSSAKFSETEKELLKEKTNENLTWENFNNAKIICKYEENLNSSRFEDVKGAVESYEITKKKNNENFNTMVATIPVDNLKTEGMYYVVRDYNVNNNTNYEYYISPLTADAVQTTLTNKIVTKWEDYILCPLIIDEENKNRYQIALGEDLKPIIWDFGLNCTEGEITLNYDKTVFTTFAAKPKISKGDLNYKTSNFSCLLGEISYNNHYYESTVLMEKWEDMLSKYDYYLFKNPKGDKMIITIDESVKKKYMNQVANYYIDTINNIQEVTNRPTTISFDYTEILPTKDIQIYI